MRRAFTGITLMAALWVAVGAWAAEPPGQYQGVLGGADYRIVIPDEWNGVLVIFAHGYQSEAPGVGQAFPEPLDSYLEKHHYAWASSGYRSKGYRPDWFAQDLLALRAHFIERFGPPRWTIIHGQSMGGHIAIASLELHPEVYQGALIECGVIDGVGLVDWAEAYTAAAEYFSGLPLLETPHPEFDRLANVDFPKLMGVPGHYTERGELFDNVVKHLAGGDLPLRLEGLAQRYITDLHPLGASPAEAPTFLNYADTRQIRYDIDPGLAVDAATLNRDIHRARPDPNLQPNPVFAELTGKITVPVMTLHETADFRAPFWLEQDYRRRTERVGTSHLLVQRAIRAAVHCGYSNAERAEASEDLINWIRTGKIPEGDDVTGDPSKLGLRWTRTWDPRDPAVPHK